MKERVGMITMNGKSANPDKKGDQGGGGGIQMAQDYGREVGKKVTD